MDARVRNLHAAYIQAQGRIDQRQLYAPVVVESVSAYHADMNQYCIGFASTVAPDDAGRRLDDDADCRDLDLARSACSAGNSGSRAGDNSLRAWLRGALRVPASKRGAGKVVPLNTWADAL